MTYLFDKNWFRKNQKLLLFLLNNSIISIWFRWVLRIHKDISLKEKISEIQPNNYNVYLGMFLEKKGLYHKYRRNFRTHNKFSKRLYNAFYPIWWAFHQWDMFIANSGAIRELFGSSLNLGFDTLTVYPDAGSGGTTVDGTAYKDNAVADSWASLIAETGNGGNTTGVTNQMYYIVADGVHTYSTLGRGIFTFDTSALGAGATISDATISFFGSTVRTDQASPAVNVFASNPTNNNNIVAGDLAHVGSTAFSTTILASNFSTAGYNDFVLNASGLANISKTGVSPFSTRETVYDLGATDPLFSGVGVLDKIECYQADQAGTTNDPKLVITYTSAVAIGIMAALI